MQQLGDIRYPDGSYSSRLAEMTESKELSLKSSESMIVQTLMDKIILQRRIELWDEPDPESWEWILMICQ